MNNKNNAVVVNSNKTVTVRLRITDASGHTELVQDLTEALETVLTQHFANKKWVYTDGAVFQFTAKDRKDPALLADAARLREILVSKPEGGVTVTLAGDLVGGAPKAREVRLRVTDASGHTESFEELPRAIALAVAGVLNQKKWVYVNSQVFQFDPAALQDPVKMVAETARLHDFVSKTEGEVTITLAGDLVGGAK